MTIRTNSQDHKSSDSKSVEIVDKSDYFSELDSKDVRQMMNYQDGNSSLNMSVVDHDA